MRENAGSLGLWLVRLQTAALRGALVSFSAAEASKKHPGEQEVAAEALNIYDIYIYIHALSKPLPLAASSSQVPKQTFQSDRRIASASCCDGICL